MTSADMFGRADELQSLATLIEQVPQQGCAIVIVGDPGIGKSTLLDAAARLGRDADMQVLEACGMEAEAHLPFAGLHDLLKPLLPDAGALPVVQRRALLSAFGLEDGPAPDVFMIALAALNLLADAASKRPILAVVDDVQWLHRPTQDVLAFIARRVGNDPIGIVGSVRQG